jgi:sugar phosphate isomerase/epimerase
MTYNRRKFIRQAALAAAIPFTYSQLIGCTSSSENKTTDTESKPNFSINKYGIQLWTVKEQMAQDAKATIKEIASFGYKQIESFGGESGIFWGMKPAEFKAFIDEQGLQAIGSHCNSEYSVNIALQDEFKKLCEDAAGVGMKYLTNPFPGPIATYDEWMKVAEGLNRQGEICKQFGLKTGYHNHHLEFIKVSDGQIPYKLLLDNTDKDLVDFEMDIYWVVKAKEDPIKWLNDYPGRYKLCHVKDLHKSERITEIENTETLDGDFWPHSTSCEIGTGQIDFDTILPVAKQNGVEEFIVEQERFDNSTPLQAAQKDAGFMNKYVS